MYTRAVRLARPAGYGKPRESGNILGFSVGFILIPFSRKYTQSGYNRFWLAYLFSWNRQ